MEKFLPFLFEDVNMLTRVLIPNLPETQTLIDLAARIEFLAKFIQQAADKFPVIKEDSDEIYKSARELREKLTDVENRIVAMSRQGKHKSGREALLEALVQIQEALAKLDAREVA